MTIPLTPQIYLVIPLTPLSFITLRGTIPSNYNNNYLPGKDKMVFGLFFKLLVITASYSLFHYQFPI